MNPVRKAAVVGLLEWIRRNRPEVRAISSLKLDDFMELVTEYERSKGVTAIADRCSQLQAKWRTTHWHISQYSSDNEALSHYPMG
jgi:hypothetical protein